MLNFEISDLLLLDLVHDLAHNLSMAKTINIHEAKTHLSQLLTRVEAGEEIVIARAGKPVARLVAISTGLARRPIGLERDLFKVPDDFDAPLSPEIMDEFYK